MKIVVDPDVQHQNWIAQLAHQVGIAAQYPTDVTWKKTGEFGVGVLTATSWIEGVQITTQHMAQYYAINLDGPSKPVVDLVEAHKKTIDEVVAKHKDAVFERKEARHSLYPDTTVALMVGGPRRGQIFTVELGETQFWIPQGKPGYGEKIPKGKPVNPQGQLVVKYVYVGRLHPHGDREAMDVFIHETADSDFIVPMIQAALRQNELPTKVA